MREDWDQRYADADTPWDSGTPSQRLKAFLSEGKVRGGRVLELGCGTGTNAIYLAQQGFDVTAVDLSPNALKRAREKAAEAGVKIDFIEADVTTLKDLGGPFPFVFDRGTYHVVRRVNLEGFQKMLSEMVEQGGYYFVLAGNANTSAPPNQGPPTVSASDFAKEIENKGFDLLELKQTNFDGVIIDGVEFAPLAWAALFQKRKTERSL